MKRYAFRVDSSLAIGTGHIFRCRVLARLLVAQNAEVYCAEWAHTQVTVKIYKTKIKRGK